jgi:hypothetical protein
METKDIERSRLSALAKYAPLSGILILAALMCFCVFLLANEVKRSGAVVVQSAQHETIGEPSALSSPVALAIAPPLASTQTSSEAPVMLDQGNGERKVALPDREKRIKSIGEGPRRLAKARDLRKPATNPYRIFGSPPMKASKRIKKLLVALWHRSKIFRRGYAQAGR